MKEMQLKNGSINRMNRATWKTSLAVIVSIAIQVEIAGRSLAITTNVVASGFSFSPASVTIHVGDSVTWTGLGSSHNVQTDTDPFCGLPGTTGGTCTIQFNQAGTISYYCVTHKSFNMVGTVIVQAAANAPPSVTVTNPVNGAVFAAPANVTVQASASDVDGNVTNVQVFANTTLAGTDATAPFSIVVSNLAAGSYTLKAVAVDNGGLSSTSAPVNISVVAPVSVTLSPPLIVNNLLQFSYTANTGLRYVIESSPNLATWSAVKTNVASSSNETFEETVTVNSIRYYRVGRLPNP
jgi:plastocyanin